MQNVVNLQLGDRRSNEAGSKQKVTCRRRGLGLAAAFHGNGEKTQAGLREWAQEISQGHHGEAVLGETARAVRATAHPDPSTLVAGVKLLTGTFEVAEIEAGWLRLTASISASLNEAHEGHSSCRRD